MPTLPEIPAPGTVLAGRYRIDRVLGIGGMGVVLAAHHRELDLEVALKVMRPHVLRSASAVERFLREARAASSIRCDHVARVSDFGRIDDGAPFMLMELLSGEDLAQRLASVRALPAAAAVDIVLQACEALAEAHTLGIVHRDLKPANLFLHRRRDGSEMVKVLDFGISKVRSADAVDVRLTSTAAMMGSPLYMSPEQLSDAHQVDSRADIWALGVILYEATMGQPPFMAPSVAELGMAICHDTPRPMIGVSSDFTAAVMQCLAKLPAGRFADVGALARALAPHASPLQRASVDRIARVLATPPPSHPRSSEQVAAPQPSPPRQSTTGASANDARPPTRTRAKLVMVGAGAAATTLVLAVSLRPRSPSVEAPPATPMQQKSAPVVQSFLSATTLEADAATTAAPTVSTARPETTVAAVDAAPPRRPLPLAKPQGPAPQPIVSPTAPSPQTPPTSSVRLGTLE